MKNLDMQNKYELLDREVLLKKAQNLKRLTQIFTVTMIIYGIVMFYLMFTGQWQANNNPLIIIPMLFVVIFMFLNNTRMAVSKEMARRNEIHGE